MIKKQQKNLFTEALYDKKEELEKIRHLLNESIETTGFTDYQELLAISMKMDAVIVEYMKLKNNR